jgi:hypothetical protein
VAVVTSGCGAGNGDCTVLLANLLYTHPFDFHVISDKMVDGLDPKIQWHIGLSYNELPKFKDESIDLCIIDTDHNFWTTKKELEALTPKISIGGVVIFHDVDKFYHDTGMAMSYWNNEPYPEKEMLRMSPYGGVGLCLIRFLADNGDKFKLISWTDKSMGAAMIERKTTELVNIITPASNPPFAKPYGKKPQIGDIIEL